MRAAYIGGCTASSNVEAGRRYGIPIFGTLAHAFIMAYTKEEEAFTKFHRFFPEHSVLLVDTYDTLAAVAKIIEKDLHPTAIRLDSGDLLELSLRARQRLDEAGLNDTKIFASGDLDAICVSTSQKSTTVFPAGVPEGCVSGPGKRRKRRFHGRLTSSTYTLLRPFRLRQ